MADRNPYPKLPPHRENEVGELAEFIANDRFPSGRIEPEKVARDLGVAVISGHYGDEFDGLLEHDGGKFFIYCNLDRVESMSSSRARFTIAHELGHYFIDDHRNALKRGEVPKHPSFCDHESKNLVEQEADHFASCLLMPSARFRKRAKSLDTGLVGIRQLSNECGTSLTSSAIRYAKLDLMTCVIIKWSKSGYGWKWISRSAYEIGWRKTIEEAAKIIPESATGKAMALQLPGQTVDVQRTGSTASSWFPFVDQGSFRDRLLLEEAVSLGQFGVLTLLAPLPD